MSFFLNQKMNPHSYQKFKSIFHYFEKFNNKLIDGNEKENPKNISCPRTGLQKVFSIIYYYFFTQCNVLGIGYDGV